MPELSAIAECDDAVCTLVYDDVRSSRSNSASSQDSACNTSDDVVSLVFDSDRSDAGSSTCTTIPSPMLGFDTEWVLASHQCHLWLFLSSSKLFSVHICIHWVFFLGQNQLYIQKYYLIYFSEIIWITRVGFFCGFTRFQTMSVVWNLGQKKKLLVASSSLHVSWLCGPCTFI